MSQLPPIPIRVLEAVWCQIEEWNHRNTAAPWWRLYWNDRPGWTAHHAGKRFPLAQNRVVLIAPETNFLAHSLRPAGHLYFHFLAGPPFHQLREQIHTFTADATLMGAVSGCRKYLAQRDTVRTALSVPALCSLALLGIEPSKASLDERMQRVLAFLDERPALDVRVEQLAALCDMHPSSFGRWFKGAFKTTPRAFITERTADRACSLLRFTKEPIEQIAEQLGFCDRFYFSRVFKKHRGKSPSEFRKQPI